MRRLIPLLVVLAYVGICPAVQPTRAALSSDWTSPIDITQPSSSDRAAFGFLICDSRQNLHLFWTDITDNDSEVYYRTDQGGEWSVPVDVIAVPKLAIRLDAFVHDDTVHLFWEDAYIGGETHHSSAPLAKAGDPRAWSAPEISDHFYVGPDGRFHAFRRLSSEQDTVKELFYLSSSNNGAAWSSPTLLFSESYVLPSDLSTRVAIDGANRIHVGITVRSQEYGAYSEVLYLRSPDGGETWDPTKMVSRMGTTFQGVSTIAPYAFGENEIHLSWHDPRRMHQMSSDGGATWSTPAEIMPLGAAFGGANHLVKDSRGVLHAIVATGGGVFSATRIGDFWSEYQQVDGRSIDPHGQQLVVCQGNRLHAVYYDRTGDGKVWYSTRAVIAPSIPRGTAAIVPESTPAPLPSRAAVPGATQSEWVEAGSSSVSLAAGEAPSRKSTRPILTAISLTLLIIVATVALGRHRGRDSITYHD